MGFQFDSGRIPGLRCASPFALESDPVGVEDPTVATRPRLKNKSTALGVAAEIAGIAGEESRCEVLSPALFLIAKVNVGNDLLERCEDRAILELIDNHDRFASCRHSPAAVVTEADLHARARLLHLFVFGHQCIDERER